MIELQQHGAWDTCQRICQYCAHKNSAVQECQPQLFYAGSVAFKSLSVATKAQFSCILVWSNHVPHCTLIKVDWKHTRPSKITPEPFLSVVFGKNAGKNSFSNYVIQLTISSRGFKLQSVTVPSIILNFIMFYLELLFIPLSVMECIVMHTIKVLEIINF